MIASIEGSSSTRRKSRSGRGDLPWASSTAFAARARFDPLTSHTIVIATSGTFIARPVTYVPRPPEPIRAQVIASLGLGRGIAPLATGVASAPATKAFVLVVRNRRRSSVIGFLPAAHAPTIRPAPRGHPRRYGGRATLMIRPPSAIAS